MAFPTNASGTFQEDHWYIWHIYLITALGCPIFQSFGKKQNFNFTETRQGPKISSIFTPIIRSSTACKLFEKVILKIVQRHVEERGMLNARQFVFRARHSTTLQCVRFTDHVTLDFNNIMSKAFVFLDIEKAFDTTWFLGLLYKLSELKFSISLLKLISSSLSQRKVRVSIEGECLRQGIYKQGYHKVPSSPPHCTVYI
jgi:hypothetical protein